MAGRDVIPSIPPIPPDTPRGMRALLQALRDVVLIRSGQSKDQLNRSPTMQELVDLGILTQSGASSGGTVIFQPPPTVVPGEGYDPSTDTTPPPAPGGFSAGATPFSVILSWSPILGHDNLRISHAEVYTSTTNSLAGAVFLGVGQHTYVHEFDYDPGIATRYYWVRYKSIAGISSTYAPSNTTGLAVTMAQDPNYVLDLISGEIREDDLAAELVSAIGDGQTALTQVTAMNGKFTVKVQAGTENNANPIIAGFGLAVDSNTAGPNSRFYVAADRFAVFNPAFPTNEDLKATFVIDTGTNRVMMTGAMIQDATITNAHIVELAADKLFVNSGTIAQAIIGTAHIDYGMIERYLTSNGYVNSAGQFNGWRIDKEGMIQASALRIYDPQGNIILGADDGSYAARLDSWLTSSNKIQGLNYNGGCDILMPGQTSRPAGWFKAGTTAIPAWGATQDTVIVTAGQLINTAIRVNPGTRYEVVARVKSLAGSHTADLTVWSLTGDMPDGKAAVGPSSAGNPESAVATADAASAPSVQTNLAANFLVQTGVYEIVTATWTPPAGTKWASFGFNTQGEDIEVDYLLVGDQSTRVVDAITPDNPITAGNIGTYMNAAIIDSAYIKNAAITSAKIQDAAITRLKLAGQTVMLPLAGATYTYPYLYSQSFTNPDDFAVPVIVGWNGRQTSGPGNENWPVDGGVSIQRSSNNTGPWQNYIGGGQWVGTDSQPEYAWDASGTLMDMVGPGETVRYRFGSVNSQAGMTYTVADAWIMVAQR